MAITVYWACMENEWIKAEKPEKVSKRFYDLGIKDNDRDSLLAVNHCPFFNESLKNIYAIKSIYDYSFKIEDNNFLTLDYGEDFFNNHVLIRSIEKKFFSFKTQYVFFTDEESLEIDCYQHPIFEENEISKRCMIIPGSLNIGKYFRGLEFSFILKKDFNEFILKEQDVMYYLKFNTKEKIIFKQFKVNDNLMQIARDIRLINWGNKNMVNVEYFYKKFKGKKYILNEIKNNLIE
jgi:hypothetical protein